MIKSNPCKNCGSIYHTVAFCRDNATTSTYNYAEEKSKTCPICNTVFTTLDVRIKYCSTKCSKQGTAINIQKRRAKYERNNILKFGTMDSNVKPVMTFKCKNCGQKFSRYRSQVQKRGAGYCSVECRAEGKTNEKPTDKQLCELWSAVVKLYDDKVCAYCGKTTYLNSHHIFSRSNMSTRYSINNGITLCAGCHTLSSRFSAHKTPVEFVEWIKEKRGEEWYSSLRLLAKSSKKYTKDELIEVKGNFKDIISHHTDDGFTDVI